MGAHISKAATAHYYLSDRLALGLDMGTPAFAWIRTPQQDTDVEDWKPRDERLLGFVLSGRSPDGERVSHRGGRTVRGFDVDLSADKAVSIAWMQEEDTILRQAIAACQQDAALHAGTAMLDLPFAVRSGAGGRWREPARPPIALVMHLTARPEMILGEPVAAPHLHSHLLVANLARRGDGSWGGIDAAPLFTQIARLETLYRTRLDANLARLGLACDRSGPRLMLRGVDPILVEAFSPRRRALLAAMPDAPDENAARRRAELAKASRHAKSRLDLGQLDIIWRALAVRILVAAANDGEPQATLQPRLDDPAPRDAEPCYPGTCDPRTCHLEPCDFEPHDIVPRDPEPRLSAPSDPGPCGFGAAAEGRGDFKRFADPRSARLRSEGDLDHRRSDRPVVHGERGDPEDPRADTTGENDDASRDPLRSQVEEATTKVVQAEDVQAEDVRPEHAWVEVDWVEVARVEVERVEEPRDADAGVDGDREEEAQEQHAQEDEDPREDEPGQDCEP